MPGDVLDDGSRLSIRSGHLQNEASYFTSPTVRYAESGVEWSASTAALLGLGAREYLHSTRVVSMRVYKKGHGNQDSLQKPIETTFWRTLASGEADAALPSLFCGKALRGGWRGEETDAALPSLLCGKALREG